MTSREIVNELFERSNLTNKEYAEIMRVSKQTIWDRLHSKKLADMTVQMFSDMISVFGYKVIAVKESRKTKADEFEID